MEIIVATEEKIEEIVNRCLANYKPSPEPSREPEFLYSIKELADFLHCSPTTAQKIKNSGKVRFRQFGRKVVFNTSEILADLGRKR